MIFKDAGQAEVLRAAQKDDFVMSKLRLDLAELSQKFLGANKWLKWRLELDLLSDFAYLALTTLLELQTLGEEYVNVVQVDSSKRQLPSALRRLLMASLQVGTPYVLTRSLAWLETKLPSHPVFQSLRPEVATVILNVLPRIRSLVIFLHRCHLTMFYLRGVFYHLAKRVTGTRYVLVRNWLGDNSVHRYFRILGVLTLVQLIVGSAIFLRKDLKANVWTNQLKKEQEQSTDGSYVHASLRCSLCLERRQNTTTTPCGHLFCWQCIVEWIQTKPQCPLCREEFTPSRLVCLQNYDQA